jgi:hypothetical protein
MIVMRTKRHSYDALHDDAQTHICICHLSRPGED